ncbi:hypothetical protein EVJ58_g4607 [Rhodofomes roseus]|uniref:Rho termination factor N-terminal domain-containing protein n=1 Tax=Rhodofomes roseus TaxID=34475 RepID=A0A4Y9YGN6_9APHY|nr:hypothetical protein EVJ58_g4607 [Rhodofomes roseus]
MSGEATTTLASLQKLTVPQLKTLCKERKITGYSKLGKAALIEKLSGSKTGTLNEVAKRLDRSKILDVQIGSELSYVAQESSTPSNPTLVMNDVTHAHTTQVHACGNRAEPSREATDAGAAIVHTLVPSSAHANQHNSTMSTQLPGNAGEAFSQPAGPASRQSADFIGSRKDKTAVPRAKKRPTPSSVGGVPKKRKVQKKGLEQEQTIPTSQASKAPVTQSSPRSALHSLSKSPASDLGVPLVSASNPSSISSAKPPLSRLNPAFFLASTHAEAPDAMAGKDPAMSSSSQRVPKQGSTTLKSLPPSLPRPVGKRFQALVVTKRPEALPTAGTRTHSDQEVDAPRESTELPSLYHLDFPKRAPAPPLSPITLPPSLVQRKRVQQWAIILSGLSDAERRQCVVVSRMFRYAVYLSAFHVLKRQHDGRRFSQDVSQYSQAMTNMWPYLRLRVIEALQRRRIYEATFLAKFIYSRGLPNPIADRLWSSPDDHKQIGIALKLWFALSIGSGNNDSISIAWLQAVVVDVQPIISGEIWGVTVEHDLGSSRIRETFYVLEATCEPVGCPGPANSPEQEQNGHLDVVPVRADWSDYINRLRSSNGPAHIKLLDQMKWAGHEEYERGISHVWLKRIQREGELGQAKRIVAERYVLACVIANRSDSSFLRYS